MNAFKVKLALLIDDNDTDLFVHKRFVEISQFADQVITFRSAIEALGHLSDTNEPPEIIFLDLNMPMMDGFEFLEKFNGLPEKIINYCKVVVLTSSGNVSDRNRAVKFQNVIDFISKPLGIHSLEQIKKSLQNQEGVNHIQK
jgi:CheY-like chemotaxis protein